MTFKVGDKVRVVKKVASFTDGWRNVWASGMNTTVGKEGVVVHVLPDLNDISVKIGSEQWGYPASALEKVMEIPAAPAINVAQNRDGFSLGQRVYIPSWNVGGFITHFDPKWIYVKTDNGRTGGWFASSLRPELTYVVEVSFSRVPSEQFFHRSCNDWKGKGLRTTTFTVFSEAVEAAQAQQDRHSSYYQYRVVSSDGAKFNAVVRPNTPAPKPALGPKIDTVSASSTLELAKQIAVTKAKQNPLKQVNMDVVQAELAAQGIASTVLGNAAGQVFKGANWKNTGMTVKSSRKGNNRRPIAVWEYIGGKS